MKGYAYKPYCPWRHGYRRERLLYGLVTAAKLFLILECLWFSWKYIEANTTKQVVVEENAGNLPEPMGKEEFYGVGIAPKEGVVYWFHNWFSPEK